MSFFTQPHLVARGMDAVIYGANATAYGNCSTPTVKNDLPLWTRHRGLLRNFFEANSGTIFSLMSDLDPIELKMNAPFEDTVGGQIYHHCTNHILDCYILCRLLCYTLLWPLKSSSYSISAFAEDLFEERKKLTPPNKIPELEKRINDILSKHILVKDIEPYTVPYVVKNPVVVQSKPCPEEKSLTIEPAVSNPKNEYDANVCVICLDAPRTVLIMNCMHLALCKTCSDTVEKSNDKSCPICKQNIVKMQPVLLP